MEFVVACATNDKVKFLGDHFGDAEYYCIYKLDSNGYELIETINNTTEEEDEEIHADPKKAKGITQLLKVKKVNVVMTKVFGPNIKRIRKKFVSVLTKKDTLEEALTILVNNTKLLEETLNAGEERELIRL
ncbi:NifB/NifX family molybdenum-iron cluster-binding protein [Clostridiaceae bacterium HSG29]|nr:NifB/NifX family molybdenum-iron cluster-binding protein [Clostridiaceae bacterium HSG29]